MDKKLIYSAPQVTLEVFSSESIMCQSAAGLDSFTGQNIGSDTF